MEITVDTRYTPQALSALAYALRKSVRRKRSRRTHIFGAFVILLGLLLTILSLSRGEGISVRTVITWLCVVVLTLVLLFEDKINGWIAWKRMPDGMTGAHTVFGESGYRTETSIGNSEFFYNNITAILDTKSHLIFVYDRSHGQVYDKTALTPDAAAELFGFLEETTGLKIIRLKH